MQSRKQICHSWVEMGELGSTSKALGHKIEPKFPNPGIDWKWLGIIPRNWSPTANTSGWTETCFEETLCQYTTEKL